ncbi:MULTISPECIES: hypothetical protein [unclassified Pseudomonas]|uniref:hypothetical protein n=1 Tax=unclassified Pseudomonas TaxID=196821 RepID=UPI002AC8D5D5|nr:MULTISPECIES: hypothetical protein [unclassified Pseudomonas]MEB0046760.1 hypothetical protein [Pseudomonas sp. Dout3]MEB0097632.1 hypothetical protein [Pseudomonas sp. DC1.2]WPX61279.1 hypothetical protein RHM68_11780 [Pseudomonas sp. DC1.2]
MKTSYWLAVACLAASVSGNVNAGFRPIEVNDQELSQLRGRFVMPGRIISFGVIMSSTWRNASGDLIGATTSMQIQAATVQPQLYVSTIKQTGNGTTPSLGTGNVIGGAGLSSTEGVTQSVRAAGDSNTAYNNVGINVTQSSTAPALVAGQGQLLMNGQTISGSNGAGSVAVSTTGGGVQVAIQASNNQGSALQQVAQGGLLQNTKLLGSSNSVNNLTQLNVVLNNNLNASAGAMQNLNQLKGLRNLGY